MRMEPKPPERLPSQEKVFDGITYTLFPQRGRDGYLVPRLCGQCGERSVSSVSTSTLELAIARAEINLLTHHGILHRKPGNPDNATTDS